MHAFVEFTHQMALRKTAEVILPCGVCWLVIIITRTCHDPTHKFPPLFHPMLACTKGEGTWMGVVTFNGLPYFLEISPHLEILPPSKCCRIFLPTHPINAATEILAHGKGLTFICVSTHVHTNRLIIEAGYVRACRSL